MHSMDSSIKASNFNFEFEKMDHPYMPPDLIIEGFQPISLSEGKILGTFFVAWGVLLVLLVSFLS